MAETVHATAVLVGVHGVLIRGASGSGKSTLALGLIERGARLVADDRVHLAARGGRLLASADARIAGIVELRGRGLIEVPHERSCVLRLIVDLVSEDALERLPEDNQLSAMVLGIALPRQPVAAPPERALRLVVAALNALSTASDIGLAKRGCLGMMAALSPPTALS
jgi:serine kinase of HPr protein (carbohydrate metabolism regulator)